MILCPHSLLQQKRRVFRRRTIRQFAAKPWTATRYLHIVSLLALLVAVTTTGTTNTYVCCTAEPLPHKKQRQQRQGLTPNLIRQLSFSNPKQKRRPPPPKEAPPPPPPPPLPTPYNDKDDKAVTSSWSLSLAAFATATLLFRCIISVCTGTAVGTIVWVIVGTLLEEAHHSLYALVATVLAVLVATMGSDACLQALIGLVVVVVVVNPSTRKAKQAPDDQTMDFTMFSPPLQTVDLNQPKTSTKPKKPVDVVPTTTTTTASTHATTKQPQESSTRTKLHRVVQDNLFRRPDIRVPDRDPLPRYKTLYQDTKRQVQRFWTWRKNWRAITTTHVAPASPPPPAWTQAHQENKKYVEEYGLPSTRKRFW